mmetsp:Transcript_26746/g.63190  ORF Transcript_26746/g.63190 Transcript_26746/m.63190 type:complete len:771 (+) Transcript_26746:1839-4151(+)
MRRQVRGVAVGVHHRQSRVRDQPEAQAAAAVLRRRRGKRALGGVGALVAREPGAKVVDVARAQERAHRVAARRELVAVVRLQHALVDVAARAVDQRLRARVPWLHVALLVTAVAHACPAVVAPLFHRVVPVTAHIHAARPVPVPAHAARARERAVRVGAVCPGHMARVSERVRGIPGPQALVHVRAHVRGRHDRTEVPGVANTLGDVARLRRAVGVGRAGQTARGPRGRVRGGRAHRRDGSARALEPSGAHVAARAAPDKARVARAREGAERVSAGRVRVAVVERRGALVHVDAHPAHVGEARHAVAVPGRVAALGRGGVVDAVRAHRRRRHLRVRPRRAQRALVLPPCRERALLARRAVRARAVVPPVAAVPLERRGRVDLDAGAGHARRGRAPRLRDRVEEDRPVHAADHRPRRRERARAARERLPVEGEGEHARGARDGGPVAVAGRERLRGVARVAWLAVALLERARARVARGLRRTRRAVVAWHLQVPVEAWRAPAALESAPGQAPRVGRTVYALVRARRRVLAGRARLARRCRAHAAHARRRRRALCRLRRTTGHETERGPADRERAASVAACARIKARGAETEQVGSSLAVARRRDWRAARVVARPGRHQVEVVGVVEARIARAPRVAAGTVAERGARKALREPGRRVVAIGARNRRHPPALARESRRAHDARTAVAAGVASVAHAVRNAIRRARAPRVGRARKHRGAAGAVEVWLAHEARRAWLRQVAVRPRPAEAACQRATLDARRKRVVRAHRARSRARV